MALADDILSRYKGRSGPAAPAAEPDGDEDPGKTESQIAAGKALIAAVKRGDANAVCEAVKAITSEGY